MARVVAHSGSLAADPTELARCRALLSDGERARASRFRDEATRRRFIVRRARLRELLASTTGEHPAALTFLVGPLGKPHLPGGPMFSASHSAERWLVALGPGELGADIEAIDPAIDWDGIARTLFAPAEAAAIHTPRAFFDCWARKEAFVKALGQGLSHPLHAFEVSVAGEATFNRGGEGWRIAALPLGAAFAGAVAAVDDGTPLRIELVDEGAFAVAA